MQQDLLNILLAFLEGFALIISPCILPILPIMLAGSWVDNKQRRLVGMLVGFVSLFALFAFFSRQLVQHLSVDTNVIRHVAYWLLLALGIIMLSSWLTEQFNRLASRLLSRAQGLHMSLFNSSQTGFFSGFFLGGLIGIVWTPCAGPILAAVIVQIVIQKTTFMSFLSLLAFALGAAIPMVIIVLYGIKIMNSFAFFKTHAVWMRRLLGAITVASVAYMVYQEQVGIDVNTPGQPVVSTAGMTLQQGLWAPYKAPEINNGETWINSSPLQLSALKGKVVLVDFWTYSCINCVRTLPYLKDWYAKYHDKGLVIIGVHSPEFDFEKNLKNVQRAVKHDGVLYPVLLDNQFITWRRYDNHYWPAHYLINKQGDVVYTHFGEGDYAITEHNIRYLLGLDKLAKPAESDNHFGFTTQTPETYLGYARAEASNSPALTHDKAAHYDFPTQLEQNSWALQGLWQVMPDRIIAREAKAALKMQFNATKVFMVAGNGSQKPIKISVRLNGQELTRDAGKDVSGSSVVVDHDSIYELLAFPQFSSGTLELTISEPGLTLYTFTFSAGITRQ